MQSGQVSMATLNDMVTRILTEMFQFNEFNNPPTGSTSTTVTTPAHQAVSTAVAEAGTVLLKNTGGTLPLSANGAGTVAVIGPAASPAPTDTGGGSAYVTSTFNVTPLQGIQAAAGPGTTVQYAQGLPTDTSLTAIPSSDLTPAYTGTNYGQTYTGTLTAPETGTYVLAFKNPGSYTATNLSLDGKQILANPGTPPVSTYSVGVNLQAGQTYTLQLSGGGPSANLSWATPSDLSPQIAQAVTAAQSASTAVVVVSDDTESEAADRASLNLPSAQDELISAVAAANPHTVVVIDAGAPVAMPWLNQVASVVDAWYPGESNGTALAAVLFGQVDPSGHLPVTFPTDLSQVPASSPSQFPGVDGQVQYSEGINVGYRYYDANNETPLFPFGYGLSYTNFRFSGLSITPQSLQNATSNPGTTACGCNGQSGQLVTVSATVTNTGQVAGSEVAQLYLDDPAAAGRAAAPAQGIPEGHAAARPVHDRALQPDRPRPVVLERLGQRLGGARGPVRRLRRRQFGAGQPAAARRLHGRAQRGGPVRHHPGPGCRAPGQHRDGHRQPRQRRRLRDAAGAVHPERPGRLDGDQSGAGHHRTGADRHRALPGDRARERRARRPHSDGLGHAAAGPPGGRTGQVEASATVAVPYASLAAAYNNTGISDNSNEAAANYDGVGDSFSAQALAAGTPTALTPGQQVTIGGTTFTWPAAASGTPDNVVTAGQTVELSGSGTDLGFLGASQNGTASGTVTVHYTDGSSQSYNLNMADWYSNSPAVGNQILTTTSSWNGPQAPHPVSVYFGSVPLQQGKQVASVTLPILSNAGGTTAMHIFAMATGTGTPTTGAPYSSLAAAYDNAGISDNSNPAAADFDGTGDSFSAQALAAGTPTPLTPGGQATFGGTTFTWPSAVGAPDNVIADGQTIDLSGSGTDLGFLGSGAFGAASGTGTITYTDGSTQQFSLAMADWYNNAPVAGDQIATTTTSWNFSSSTQVPHPVSIYFASVPLQAGKTVASVTLPTVSATAGNGVNAMHIFAMAIGSGTPTGG